MVTASPMPWDEHGSHLGCCCSAALAKASRYNTVPNGLIHDKATLVLLIHDAHKHWFSTSSTALSRRRLSIPPLLPQRLGDWTLRPRQPVISSPQPSPQRAPVCGPRLLTDWGRHEFCVCVCFLHVPHLKTFCPISCRAEARVYNLSSFAFGSACKPLKKKECCMLRTAAWSCSAAPCKPMKAEKKSAKPSRVWRGGIAGPGLRTQRNTVNPQARRICARTSWGVSEKILLVLYVTGFWTCSRKSAGASKQNPRETQRNIRHKICQKIRQKIRLKIRPKSTSKSATKSAIKTHALQ